jgi:glycosyltransferase involved in cell wall biosynthesis
MNAKPPLVSFIIVSFDEPYELLVESIYSIRNQDYSNIEIIHINNGTNDNNSFKELSLSKHIVYKYYHKGGLGFTKALNFGIDLASGDYIFRQDPDDFSDFSRVRITLNYFNSIECDFISTSTKIVNEEGLTLGLKLLNANKFLTLADLEFSNPLVHGSLAFKKKTIERIGGYNESFVNSQDYELYAYSLKQGLKIYLVPDFLYSLRVRVGSVSALYNTSVRQTLMSFYIKKFVVMQTSVSRVNYDESRIKAYVEVNEHVDKIVYRKKMYALSANGQIMDICLNFNFKYLLHWMRALIIASAPKIFYRWFY